VIELATFGYFKEQFLMTSGEAASIRAEIVKCAAAHGKTLDALYVDRVEMASRALYECLMSYGDTDEKILIVPNLLHFAGEGDPLVLRSSLEDLGFTVLIAQPKQAGRTC